MKKSSIIYSVLLINLLIGFASNLNAQNTSLNSVQIKTGFVNEKGLLKFTILTSLERSQILTEVLAPVTPVKKKSKNYMNYDSGSQMSVFNPNYQGSYEDLMNQDPNNFVITPVSYKENKQYRLSGLAKLGFDILSGSL